MAGSAQVVAEEAGELRNVQGASEREEKAGFPVDDADSRLDKALQLGDCSSSDVMVAIR